MLNIYWSPINKLNKFIGKLSPIKNKNKLIVTPVSKYMLEKKLINKINKKQNNNNCYSVAVSGRLNGVTKARKLKIKYGALKPQTIKSKINNYNRPIYTKWGIIGLKVSVLNK